MGTIRFSNIVETAGKPIVHALWIEPAKDSVLQNAIKANRVMTIHQRTAGLFFQQLFFSLTSNRARRAICMLLRNLGPKVFSLPRRHGCYWRRETSQSRSLGDKPRGSQLKLQHSMPTECAGGFRTARRSLVSLAAQSQAPDSQLQADEEIHALCGVLIASEGRLCP